MYVLHIKLKIWKVNKNCPILVKTLSLYYCLYCNNWHSLFKLFKTGLIISHYPNMIFILKFLISQTVSFYKRDSPVQNCMELKIAIQMKKNCQACTWSLCIGRAYKKNNSRTCFQFVLYRFIFSVIKWFMF